MNGIYQVSDFGRIKSLKFMKEKILSPKKTKGGYLQVLLYKNGKKKNYRVHRLVAQSFLPNSDNKSEINHIDGNKENNNIYNLEWVTGRENKKHAYKIGLRGTTEEIRKMCIKNGKKACKPIYQFDINGNFIKEWNSQTEASQKLKIRRTSIGNCLGHRNKTAGGYIWKFKEENMRKFEYVKRIKDIYETLCMGIDFNLPIRKTAKSAGYDFECIETVTIPPYKLGDKPVLVPTGVKCKMQDDEYLMLVNRSSNPKKKNLVIPNSMGIIDADYYGNPDNDGEMMFAFYNLGTEPVTIEKGYCLGQGIFCKYLITDNDNAEGERVGGFGSTNK